MTRGEQRSGAFPPQEISQQAQVPSPTAAPEVMDRQARVEVRHQRPRVPRRKGHKGDLESELAQGRAEASDHWRDPAMPRTSTTAEGTEQGNIGHIE
jgi:hypothetical protein